MSKRYPGNFITGNPVAITQSSNNGIWDLKDNYTATGNNTWEEPDSYYEVGGSLRFAKSSANYLTRTPPVAGNRKTWTYSVWIKKTILINGGNNMQVLDAGRPNSPWTSIYLSNGDGSVTGDSISIALLAAGVTPGLHTSALHRDTSAWWHFVLAVDTTQAIDKNRIKVWQNGVQLTAFQNSVYPSQNADTYVNSTANHAIGALSNGAGSGYYYDGYYSEINLIDGQALDASYFGYFDSLSGIWSPKKYTGKYGTNGCYLPLQPSTQYGPSYATTNLPYCGGFSGSSQNLQIANQSAFNIGTADFCIEGWFYFNSLPGSGIMGMWGFNNGSGSQAKMTAYIDTSGYVHYDFTLSGGASQITSNIAVKTGVWMHIAWVRSNNVATLYMNGASVGTTSLTTNLTGITAPFYIGYVGESSNCMAGYICNFRFVKGSPVYTSNFVPQQTQASTAITGTQLLYLITSTVTADASGNNYTATNNGGVSSFASAHVWDSNISLDYSLNGNWWYAVNFNTYSPGLTYDISVDSPTNVITNVTSDTGGIIPGNYATLNFNGGTHWGSTGSATGYLSDAGLKQLEGGHVVALSTQVIEKYPVYWEVYLTNWNQMCGIISPDSTSTTSYSYSDPTAYGVYCWTTGAFVQGGSFVASGFPYGFGTSGSGAFQFACDPVSGKMWVGYNGTMRGNPAAGTGNDFSFTAGQRWLVWNHICATGQSNTATYNFGQRPFAYTPPAGFKSLNTTNLQMLGTSAISNGAQRANKNFDVTLYGGVGTNSQSPTNSGFQPDLVWIKNRTSGSNYHMLADSVRGANAQLASNSTDAENQQTSEIQGFNSNGFTVGSSSDVNSAGSAYVAWQWKASNTKTTNTDGSLTSTISVNKDTGFSIVSYVGNSASNQTVGHGLGTTPAMIICKSRNAGVGTNWVIWHQNMSNLTDSIYFLNRTDTTTVSQYWGSAAPTSSVFGVKGGGYDNNQNGVNQIAYVWAQCPGFSRFGMYIGNGGSDGSYIYCGFRPKIIMYKAVSGTAYDWGIYDVARDPVNPVSRNLAANTSAADSTYTYFDILSNGFKPKAVGNSNENNSQYIYAAFAESPFGLNNRAR
jgi:hypothetical protein